MLNAFMVGMGGFAGAVLRYLLTGWFHRLTPDSAFPIGTFGVNIIGCLTIGLLSGYAENVSAFSPGVRCLVLVGLLGGFTTFSTFAHESVGLTRSGQFHAALINVGLQVALGLTAAWVGYALTTLSKTAQ